MTKKAEIGRQQAIETVEASPRFVGEHDKEAWLELFAAAGLVEDPVGVAPSRRGARLRGGEDEVSRFYDTFIADNRIRFEVERDIVVGDEVIRDVAIHTTLATGLSIVVPAILRYTLTVEDGLPKIARLEAHWELPRMSQQILSKGPKGVQTMMLTSWTMFRRQGVRGLMNYSKGMVRGIFGRGRRVAAKLAAAVTVGDRETFTAAFAPAAIIDSRAEGGATIRQTPREFFDSLGPAASLSLAKVTASGWMTSFRLELRRGAETRHGIGFLTFDRRTRQILGARLYFS